MQPETRTRNIILLRGSSLQRIENCGTEHIKPGFKLGPNFKPVSSPINSLGLCALVLHFVTRFGGEEGAAAEVISVRRKLSPCQRWTGVQAGSKMAKAETIGITGGTSVTTHLGKGKKCCTAAVKEQWENISDITLQTPRSVLKEGEMSEIPEQRFPCRPW